MTMIANVLVGLVALLHLYFLVLEMFLWTTTVAARSATPEFAHASKTLAANQACTTASSPPACSGACSPAARSVPPQAFSFPA